MGTGGPSATFRQSQPWRQVPPGPLALPACSLVTFPFTQRGEAGTPSIPDLELGRDLSTCPMLCPGPRSGGCSQPSEAWTKASGQQILRRPRTCLEKGLGL